MPPVYYHEERKDTKNELDVGKVHIEDALLDLLTDRDGAFLLVVVFPARPKPLTNTQP